MGDGEADMRDRHCNVQAVEYRDKDRFLSFGVENTIKHTLKYDGKENILDSPTLS